MLTYSTLKDRPREFLVATGLTSAEFARGLPAFAAAYAVLYPPDKTGEGTVRQRQGGGGATGVLPQMEDTLLLILVSQKTTPRQTLHGWQCALSQPQTNYWLPHWLPVLQGALAALEVAPERAASRVAPRPPLTVEGAPNWAIAGTERRRQRPPDARAQKAHYRGKQKAQTDKNLLRVNDNTGKVSYLGPTLAGTTHDTRAADAGQIAYPPTAPLDQDTGFPGSEPEGVLTTQPKKSPQATT